MNKTIHAEASAVINAPSANIYAVISDYRVGHPAIVPMPYFSELTVEQGGQGAGTVIRATMTAFGKVYPLHQRVTEPEPGHILMETDIETGQYTTFTFEPLANDTQTRVTIASEFPRTPGFVGFIESVSIPAFTRRLYKQELENLSVYASRKATATPAN
ncbi:MAG: SRPBCC family protein [Chloroflexota bacterium]